MNPLFKKIYDAVVVKTNRPNLIRETKDGIKEATLDFHQRGRFIKDMRQARLTSTNGGQLEYNFQIPENRRIRSILAVQAVRSDGKLSNKLKQLDLFSEPGCGNIGYTWAGNSLKIFLPSPATTFALTYLEFPDLSEDLYDSWIAKTYPQMIVAAATVKVMVPAGMIEQANYYQALIGATTQPDSYLSTLLRENTEVDSSSDFHR